jgi:cation-transporting ATPase E
LLLCNFDLEGALGVSASDANKKLEGLSQSQVDERVRAGQVNVDSMLKTRSVSDIVRDNICTLFNLVNVILAALVFVTGSYKNMLFLFIIVINVVIGIVQEIRSKITTDKLSIVAASKIDVLRDGEIAHLQTDALVKDDVIRLGRGNQIPADCQVIDGACQVNESLLTGESDLIGKAVGDELMSGSFVNSGLVWARVVHVGSENYAAQITREAKAHKEVNSEIMATLNAIIKYVSLALVPVGLLLFLSTFLFGDTDFNSAILSTVSALIGMIPEGLVLLTSTVLAVAVIRLAKSKVLVQQLYCIETLARVDTLCLDKTGTITTGRMRVSSFEVAADSGVTALELERLFGSVAMCDEDPNETALAIRRRFEEAGGAKGALGAQRVIAFSSDVKWSGATLENGTSYVMGAAQFVLAACPQEFARVEAQLKAISAKSRVLLLAQVDGFDEDGKMLGQPRALGFVCIRDEIRTTAARTIKYFKDQGVALKVISGDDPLTVSGIALQVGVPGAEKYIDATTLENDEEIFDAVEQYNVFGRVKPEQKKAFVDALQANGHVVAMTGDGVNDVLALKAADCSIAMASGSDAARNMAQLVLVDNDFSSMPKVVAEGRRSINNLQRSASLFLVKTLLSMISAVLFIFLPWQYPFVPIQMTLISAFTIGLPSFVLALEPNHDLVKGHFLPNCISKSVPSAICAVASILLINIVGYVAFDFTYHQVSTLCVLIVALIGICLVIRLSVPMTPIRAALVVVVVAGTLLGVTVFGGVFDIAQFTPVMLVMYGILAAANVYAFDRLYTYVPSVVQKQLDRIARRRAKRAQRERRLARLKKLRK